MRTVRILSLDGGGIRGVFSATFLKRFCADAKIPEDQLWKYFDVICGTSTGGIQAIAYAAGKSPTEIIDLFTEKGEAIFTKRISVGGGLGPAGSVAIGFALSLADPYIYNEQPLRDAISDVMGDTKMFQLKTNTLVTSVSFTGGNAHNSGPNNQSVNFPIGNITGTSYNIFSNVLIPGFTTGQNYSCVDVAVATGSAPVYFHPVPIGGYPVTPSLSDVFYVDGGLYQNNPTALGYATSQVLFPQKVKTCILSVGTGYSLPDAQITPPDDNRNIDTPLADGYEILANALELTLSGATEAVEQQLRLMSLYKGAANNLSYYRFQRFLADNTLNQLDNPTKDARIYLQAQANAQYDQDSLKIQLFIQKLGL